LPSELGELGDVRAGRLGRRRRRRGRIDAPLDTREQIAGRRDAAGLGIERRQPPLQAPIAA
jgi:hypothetical protein